MARLARQAPRCSVVEGTDRGVIRDYVGAISPRNNRASVFPVDWQDRQVPCLSVGVVALIEKIVLSIIVLKQKRVPRLARIPAAWRSVGHKRFVRQSFEVHAIIADGHTDLLRVVVVAAGIEHVDSTIMACHRRRFDTSLLPSQVQARRRPALSAPSERGSARPGSVASIASREKSLSSGAAATPSI